MNSLGAIERAIGRIEGAIEAGNKSVDEKFIDIKKDIEIINTCSKDQNKRLISLETDRKLVTKLAGVVSVAFSVLTTALISIGIRLLS